jgi:peptidoglycan endopeptidase LytE
VKQKLVVKKPSTVKEIVKETKSATTTKPVESVKKEVFVKPVKVKAEQFITSPAAVIDEAKPLSSSLEGIPYVYGGNTMVGFDCSGFINFVHLQAGLKITRLSSADYFAQSAIVSNPVVGDLVFFENTYKEGISHMGIYLGNNEFIHAGSKGVEVANLESNYWKGHFVSFKRFYSVSVN